ncbi:uncharacterized protein BJX67DRAFT_266350 [Aspergillus lucknowensis]|uniref:Uncharacterized protein n=1 Tax=Aspergillus lucknowensis TaxID=176173 RepID=A0ABR4LF61_9EURO
MKIPLMKSQHVAINVMVSSSQARRLGENLHLAKKVRAMLVLMPANATSETATSSHVLPPACSHPQTPTQPIGFIPQILRQLNFKPPAARGSTNPDTFTDKTIGGTLLAPVCFLMQDKERRCRSESSFEREISTHSPLHLISKYQGRAVKSRLCY